MKIVLKVMETSEARAFTLRLSSSIYLWKKDHRSQNLDSSSERFMDSAQPNNTTEYRVISLQKKSLPVQKEGFLLYVIIISFITRL
jgi:hypothetical protein